MDDDVEMERIDRVVAALTPSAEALASIPAENERRARLYDALWHIAYHRGGVKLDFIGTHDVIPRVTVMWPRSSEVDVFEGDDEDTGPAILAYVEQIRQPDQQPLRFEQPLRFGRSASEQLDERTDQEGTDG